MNNKRLAALAGITLTESHVAEAIHNPAFASVINTLQALESENAANVVADLLDSSGYSDNRINAATPASLKVTVVMTVEFDNDETGNPDQGSVFVSYKDGKWEAEF